MIVTLCGSARFENRFKSWNQRLSLQGHVVLSLAVYPSDAGGKDWYTPDQKERLDAVHRLKIDASEAIFVVCGPERYVGTSTLSEVLHALSTGKRVWWEYWPTDATLKALGLHRSFSEASSKMAEACRFELCGNFLGQPPCAICYE